VAILCASTMIDGKVVLTDVPEIEEVNRILEVLESIGAKIKRSKNQLVLDYSGKINVNKMDKKSAG